MALITINGNEAWITVTEGSKVGLIVLQEWWGLNDQTKRLASRFATTGQISTISPDLYHGRVAANPDEASHLMNGLDWTAAMGEVKAAATYLRQQLGCERVGITGFCMGGAIAFSAAVFASDLIDVACPFYGIPPNVDLSKAKIPIQAHFGRKDDHKGFSDQETAQRAEEAVKASGVQCEFYTYETGHAFMNDARPEAYDAASAALGFERVLKFVRG
jgi:carboxymethylenebutenolidase